MITFKHRGGFDNTERLLKRYERRRLTDVLSRYGAEGVRALASATPVDTGISAGSWSYKTSVSKSSFSISWENSEKTSQGTPIVILLQYGHATRNGGYVRGHDFINPAIQPIMDKIAEDVWKEVTG